MYFLREFFPEKVDFKTKSADDKKDTKLSSRQTVKLTWGGRRSKYDVNVIILHHGNHITYSIRFVSGISHHDTAKQVNPFKPNGISQSNLLD